MIDYQLIRSKRKTLSLQIDQQAKLLVRAPMRLSIKKIEDFIQQKQRIAIARALYKQPEILVLDEATSSLDSTSENYIQNAIQHIRRQGKTIIVIAHRLSTVINADKIVVLSKGEIVEIGTHRELLSKKSLYAHLYSLQFPERIEL